MAQIPSQSDPIEFGPFQFYQNRKSLLCQHQRVNITRIPWLALEFILLHKDRTVTYKELIEVMWPPKGHKPGHEKDKLDVQKAVQSFLKKLTYREHQYIQNVPQWGYRFEEYKDPGNASSGESPPMGRAESPIVFDGKGLILSVDGIILNFVGELLFDRVEAPIIRECSGSYERSLGDFAFAVVYGSQLLSKWHPASPSQSDSKANKEPGALVISFLPTGLYNFEPLDEDLRNGALLRNDDDRNQVREYIGCMRQCLQEPLVVGLCRDLLVREAEKFLGVDGSLFQKIKHYSDCHFGKEYYRHDLVEEIPALLGPHGLATLVDFLPKSPQKDSGGKNKDEYEQSALIQFVSEVVLTHFTTMYEFEKSSQRQGTWRVPYALRAEITRQLSRTQQQRRLRRIVVRHALRYALREASGDDRKADIISMFVDMRGIEPFMEIREMLGELVVLKADESKEVRAMKLNRDIRNAGYLHQIGRSDFFSTSRNSILRELAKENQNDDEYRSLLCTRFPALDLRPSKGREIAKSFRRPRNS
jgi:DNA-binding winged helix-turn-helix (wHTH) protein